MATTPAEITSVFRAIVYKEKIKRNGKPHPNQFYLLPKDEGYLSFGDCPESAKLGLDNPPPFCCFELPLASVLEVGREVGLTLEFRPIPEQPGKIGLYGLPEKDADFDTAQRIAARLADLCGNSQKY